jgi:DHA3 family tetracycline resistance protein-like MFS transporter
VFGVLHRWAALRPFRNRDFRLLWAALAVSLVGDGTWLVAIPWQVISLGGGPGGLALVVGAGSVGILVSLFLGGLLADLLPRRTVLAVTSVVAALIVLSLVVLALADVLSVPAMAVGAFLLAALDGVTGPSVETLIPTLVPAQELQAANGLESLLSSIAGRALGPAIGGAVVVIAGPTGALIVDAGSFLFAGLLFFGIRGGRSPAVAKRDALGVKSVLADFREAAVFIGRHRWLWSGIGWAALALLAQIGPRQVLLPFLVVRRFHGTASDFGLLLAAYGICATAGALIAASTPTPRRYLSAMFALWAVGSVPFAFLPFAADLPVALILMGLAGLFLSIGNVFWSTLMQRAVPNELRGRVSSFDWFGTLALVPVSMAIAGALGESPTNETFAFLVAGLAPPLLAGVALFAIGLRREEERNPLLSKAIPVDAET